MKKEKTKGLISKTKLSLKADLRKVFGRKVKQLRKQDILPANLYGKKIKSKALQINLKEFFEVYKKAGETSLVNLFFSNEKTFQPILIHNLQIDPVSQKPLHVDFHQVDFKEKVQVNIPVELVGEAPGAVKGGVLVQLLNEIEIEALPTDLPEKFEVDISGLTEVGQSISVKDLKTSKDKIKLLVDDKQLLVNLEEPKEEKEEEKPAEEAAAPAEGEEKPGEDKKEEDKKEEPKEEKALEAKEDKIV